MVLHARTLRGSFQIGQINYDGHSGLGMPDPSSELEARYFTQDCTVLMSPKMFLKLAQDHRILARGSLTTRCTVLQRAQENDYDFAIPYLHLAFDDVITRISAHEGRHRSVVSLDLQPNMPVPVRIFSRYKHLSIEDILEFSKGARKQASDEIVTGPLFRVFYHQGKRFGIYEDRDRSIAREIPEKPLLEAAL